MRANEAVTTRLMDPESAVKAGAMAFEYTSFNLSDRPDMKLIVFTPLAEGGTRAKLGRLLGEKS